jgi:DNA helicase IV
VAHPEHQFEQRYLDRLYGRLDELRERADRELTSVRRMGASGTHQARSERDAFATLYENRLAQLRGVEERLCFGRLDLADRSRQYIGRIGLFDEDQAQLLVDWRAPAARDFYQATAAHPGDVVLRRHLQTKGREVTDVYDDVLDADQADLPAESASASLGSDGALLAALNAHRTGRMSDIVATIQREQDEIIRAPLEGVVVVQGGPGTGKTAVALHRAAYLLYTYRQRLESRGVLLVGPSSVFLRYISQVLPSLGETGVVTATADRLFPGVSVTATECPGASALKGDSRMSAVMSRAVRERCRPPKDNVYLAIDGTRIRVRRRTVQSVMENARRTGRPHNVARISFVRMMLSTLVDLVDAARGGSLGDYARDDIEQSLRDSKDVRRLLNLAWPPLSATHVLRDLYASPERLYATTPGWTNDERAQLLRPDDAGWTTADVPLLDELAELIGEDESDSIARGRVEAERRAADVNYAREVLQGSGSGGGMVSAEVLAERFTEQHAVRTVSESAAVDRAWAYGHVIVDEAQELSAMMWRLLRRRCPSGSMTLVGDIAQTGSDAGAENWEQMLNPVFGSRWARFELTVNYRTPAEIMEVAAQSLAAAGVSAPVPESVRSGGVPPRKLALNRGASTELMTAIRGERSAVGEGRVVVIAPESMHAELHAAVGAHFGEVAGADVDAPIAVLTAVGSKGLEFDSVVVVEPSLILAESTHGANHLYVALSRATQRLLVIYDEPLPTGMAAHLADSNALT